jgi:putative ABC transport system substrate-binding protein
VLSPFSSSFGPGPSFEAFRQTLRERGYVEGRNIALEYRWADGRYDRLPGLTAELVGLRVDALFSAWSTPAAIAAKNATSTIPIVFAGVGDAVGVGLIASLARPGGNVTGSTFIAEETIGKNLELLKVVVPRIARVGVVINPVNPVYGRVLRASEAPARALGLQLEVVEVQGAEDFELAFRAAIRHVDTASNGDRRSSRTGGFGAPACRLPAIRNTEVVDSRSHVVRPQPRRDANAAHQWTRSSKGPRPNLPTSEHEIRAGDQPEDGEGARLTIPQSLLLRADQIIQ